MAGQAPGRTGHRQAFRGVLGSKVVICKPADPEAKGLRERFHDHLERLFLPGRTFTGPDEFNTQLSGWLASTRTGGCSGAGVRPDRPARRRPGRDADVAAGAAAGRLAVLDPAAAGLLRAPGRQRLLHPPVGDRPAGRGTRRPGVGQLRRRLVADHQRLWAKHWTVTDFEHLVAAKAIRRGRADLVKPLPETDVQVRDLARYDTLLGIHDGVDDDLDIGVDGSPGPDGAA